MKRPILALAGAVALVAGGFSALAAESGHDHGAAAVKEQTLYTCGMHPQVIQNQPGNCPICGMKLTPLRRESVNTTTISIDPVTVQNMGFRSEFVTRGPVRRTIRTVGVIDFDETRLVEVTTKFDGWVEQLHANTTGQQVHRGDPLFELYAPDFYKAQVEFIAAINSAVNMPSSAAWLRAVARTNLMVLGVPFERVAELEKNRSFTTNYVVVAPQDGFVVEKMILQGQKVDAGMKLYRIADLGLVWVQAQIYEQDLPFITLGQEADVSLSYLPDRKFRGRVTYIYPTVDEKTRTVKARMEFHNPGYLLKPGMFATVELKAELAKDALLVPDSAVLRSGEKNTAFVALDGGKFDPRTITLGPRGEGNVYQVVSGLNAGERVVTSGQFMLDSESQLREAVQKMINPNAEGRAGNPLPAASVDKPDDGAHGVTRPTSEAVTNAIYSCPMPSHADVVSDKPGDCPKCGMTLVPTSEVAHGKIAEENWRKQHATEHQH